MYTLVLAEYAFLGQELELCTVQDKQARSSLSKAIQDFDEAFLALEVLQNTQVYNFMEKAISHHSEYRHKGMPKDAFHVACAGHKVRLDNVLKARASIYLKKNY